MSGFVWIVKTAEPDAEIVTVFASREAMEHEYPGWLPYPGGLWRARLDREGSEPLYASQHPLHEYAPGGASVEDWSAEDMTLREHLFAATLPGVTVVEMRQRICSAIYLLNASAPQCLDNPPGVSHRLVADPQEMT